MIRTFTEWQLLKESITPSISDSFADYTGARFQYKPCPRCGGGMTNKCPPPNETHTYKGSIRCKDCGEFTSGLDWKIQLD